jgi:hypothetical protein
MISRSPRAIASGKSRWEANPWFPDKTYKIVTNDFLAAGGDRFAAFKGGQNIQYGMDLRDLFLAWLKKHSPVHPVIEERIINMRSPMTWQMPPYVENVGHPSICPIMQARCKTSARDLVQPFQTQADNLLSYINYYHYEYIFLR